MEKISLATELIQLCLVPELITDIDTQQIEPAHFKEFKAILNENLHLLFDLLQQYETVLFEKTIETQVFRKHFVLLLCEQSAQNVPYKTDQLILQQNVTHLTDKWFGKVINEKCIFELVLQHYKTLIKVDVWKKNIGTICGFHRFCQLNYKSNNELHMNEVFFVLATGTLLLEHYEPMYKQMGIDLYNILMTFSVRHIHPQFRKVFFSSIFIFRTNQTSSPQISIMQSMQLVHQISPKFRIIKSV